VKVSHGDFVEDQLARVVNTPDRNRLLVQAYRDLAVGRRAIVFCVDVAHAHAAQQAFAEGGVRAAAVWGAMPKDERRATLARFSDGALDVVTNCVVLTEGFDEPRVDCVIMARPTRSKLLYAQMVGRGTRLHPGKSDLLVVDLADNSTTHHLPGLHSLFDLPVNMNLRGRDALAIEREVERLSRTHPWIDMTRIHSPDQLVRAAERIEFFNFDPPEELRGGTANNWYSVPGGGYRLGLPKGEWMSIAPNLLDSWDVERGGPGIGRSLIRRAPSLGVALVEADRFVAAEFPDASRLVRREERWRDREPTEKQKEMLARHGVNVPGGLTRGQVSQMISMVMASQ
jgi:ATP-dependent helicase IRC3